MSRRNKWEDQVKADLKNVKININDGSGARPEKSADVNAKYST